MVVDGCCAEKFTGLHSTIPPDAMCVRRMGRLHDQSPAVAPWFDQPIDQSSGGLPPAAALMLTGIWRPQPAARPSNNPSSTLAQAG